MSGTALNLERLRSFVVNFGRLFAEGRTEDEVQGLGRLLLEQLVAHDDWLPDSLSKPGPHRYNQYLLHADSAERFCVAAFAWAPGEVSPIHDHCTWGLIGVLRGAERTQRYCEVPDPKTLRGWRVEPQGEPRHLDAGSIDLVSPALGDIHQVSNALRDRVTVSVHVYGANPASLRRSVYGEDGSVRPFHTHYANQWLPNIWAHSNAQRGTGIIA